MTTPKGNKEMVSDYSGTKMFYEYCDYNVSGVTDTAIYYECPKPTKPVKAKEKGE